MINIQNERYLTRKELCEVLAITPRTLYNWRRHGQSPPATPVGNRNLYNMRVLAQWLVQREAEEVAREHDRRVSWARSCLAKAEVGTLGIDR